MTEVCWFVIEVAPSPPFSFIDIHFFRSVVIHVRRGCLIFTTAASVPKTSQTSTPISTDNDNDTPMTDLECQVTKTTRSNDNRRQ